jgi:hypothetical protein
MINDEELERALYWNSLCNLGNYVKLNITFQEQEILHGLDQFKENWVPYNQKKDTVNNRWGLPITSYSGDVMDNYHLNSFGYMQKYHSTSLKEEDFTKFTQVYHSIPEFSKMINRFVPDIGRIHLLKINKGGFFPPHRDYAGLAPQYFRLLAVMGNCSDFNYVHILNDQIFRPERNHLYFVNFQLNHSVFSFSDNLYALILTVKLNKKTHDLIVKHSMAQ